MTPRHGLRSRITYANVTATLALTLVVGGGTAYAAGLVHTADIANGAVTTPKVAADAVKSGKVKDGSLKLIDFSAQDMPLKDAVIRNASFTFPADNGATGQSLDATAVCNAGETVLSGGYGLDTNASVGGQPNTIVTDSRPATAAGAVPAVGTPAGGWFVEARRNSDFVATTVTVWVLCGS